MTENQINFFKANQEKIERIAQKVDKKPFIKLAFLVVLASVSLGGVLGGAYNAAIVYEGKNATTKLELANQLEVSKLKKLEEMKSAKVYEAAHLDKALKVLNSISDEEMRQFVEYLKYHQTIYDKRVSILSDALMEAHRNVGTYNGPEHTQLLQQAVLHHKKSYENLISTIQMVHYDLKSNTVQAPHGEVYKIFTLYNNYQANLLIHDVEIEKLIHTYTYPEKYGNAHYNRENNITDKIRKLDQEVEENVRQMK